MRLSVPPYSSVSCPVALLEAMICEPMPPDSDNPGSPPNRSRYRSRAPSFGRQQNNPSPSDIAL
jgi:hypothetical protein